MEKILGFVMLLEIPDKGVIYHIGWCNVAVTAALYTDTYIRLRDKQISQTIALSKFKNMHFNNPVPTAYQ